MIICSIDARSTDDEFETIYNAFGGVCHLQKCDEIDRVLIIE